MMPSHAVIADPTLPLSYALSDLLGPSTILAVFSVLVTFAVLIAGLVSEARTKAAFKRMATACAAPPAGPEHDPEESTEIEVTAAPPHAA